MTLDNLIKKIEHAWNSVDEDIADYAFRKVQKWEEKGVSKYLLGLGMDLSVMGGFGGLSITGFPGERPYAAPLLEVFYSGPAILFAVTFLPILFRDILGNVFDLKIRNEVKYASDVPTINQVDMFGQVKESLRLPYAAVGVMALGDYLWPVLKYGPEAFTHGNTKSLSVSILSLATATAFYITHNKPAAPDKVSFWKRAYNSISKKISPLVPVQLPVPIQRYEITGEIMS